MIEEQALTLTLGDLSAPLTGLPATIAAEGKQKKEAA